MKLITQENEKPLSISEIIPLKIISADNQAIHILHQKKRAILELICIKGMTIQDLKLELGENPGTIKRHLDELIKSELVFVERIEKNDYNIKMKYYRSVAEKFEIRISLP